MCNAFGRGSCKCILEFSAVLRQKQRAGTQISFCGLEVPGMQMLQQWCLTDFKHINNIGYTFMSCGGQSGTQISKAVKVL